jgi:hypothetical protein
MYFQIKNILKKQSYHTSNHTQNSIHDCTESISNLTTAWHVLLPLRVFESLVPPCVDHSTPTKSKGRSLKTMNMRKMKDPMN